MNTAWLRAIPLAILLLLALAMAFSLRYGKAAYDTSGMTGYAIGTFDVPALDNRRFSPALWRGKVAMLNVFASWCQPCAVEHEALMKLAQSGKISLYGLAWNDTPAHIATWIRERGNPYQAVGVDAHGSSTAALGLSGVPETFIFDKQGNIAYHYKGALTGDMIADVILPLAEKLNAK